MALVNGDEKDVGLLLLFHCFLSRIFWFDLLQGWPQSLSYIHRRDKEMIWEAVFNFPWVQIAGYVGLVLTVWSTAIST